MCVSQQSERQSHRKYDIISKFDRTQTVRQSNKEPVKLWYSDSHSQDGWHTTPGRPTGCDHGDPGTPDSWVRLLNYLVSILSIYEERRQSRTTNRSSSPPSAQHWGAETRRKTPELTLKTRRFSIRLQRSQSVEIVDLAVSTTLY